MVPTQDICFGCKVSGDNQVTEEPGELYQLLNSKTIDTCQPANAYGAELCALSAATAPSQAIPLPSG